MLAFFDSAVIRYGAKTILDGITAQIHDGDRIGLIGVNGAGKTTLINSLLGEIAPDEGALGVHSNVSVGYLRQNSGLDTNNSIIDEMRSVFADALFAEARMREIERGQMLGENSALSREYSRLLSFFEAKGGYGIDVEIKKILAGMGFASRDVNESIGVLSGGEKTRLAIAKLLLSAPDLLVLDEPTNHLDFETLKWLEEYLSQYKGAMLLVSHDRFFLDRTVKKIWEIEDGRLKEYKGNYSAYKVLKAEYLSYIQKEYEKQQRSIEKMEDYAARNIARASTASSAKSRLALLSHMELIEKPKTHERTPVFKFETTRRGGNDVLSVAELPVAVGEEKKIIVKSVSFEMKRGDALAVIGENGSGKSSLLRTLINELAQAGGKITWGRDADIGYYDQENKNMSPENTVIAELWDRFPGMPEHDVRGLLARVLITGEDVYNNVGGLSGGERAKLGFAILMEGRHNVLILDEPTNHLDLASREKLEDALKDFPGTLIFVSHDRYFINALAKNILEISRGAASYFSGGFDEYERVKQSETPLEDKSFREKKSVSAAKQKRVDAARKRQCISDAEKAMNALEAREKELEALIAENPSDFESLEKYCAELDTVKKELDGAMERWLLLQEER